MKPSALLAFALLLSACGVARPILESDNTKVEVKTVVERLVDTAYVELPVIVEKVATFDTTSVLENKYAKSEAIVSGGLLTHSLATKPVREPVKVEKEIVYRDSLVYRDQVVKEDIYIEKELTFWQKFRLKLGSWTIVLIVISTLYLLFQLFNNLLKLKRL
jgi:hypothetical protein